RRQARFVKNLAALQRQRILDAHHRAVALEKLERFAKAFADAFDGNVLDAFAEKFLRPDHQVGRGAGLEVEDRAVLVEPEQQIGNRLEERPRLGVRRQQLERTQLE